MVLRSSSSFDTKLCVQLASNHLLMVNTITFPHVLENFILQTNSQFIVLSPNFHCPVRKEIWTIH